MKSKRLICKRIWEGLKCRMRRTKIYWKGIGRRWPFTSRLFISGTLLIGKSVRSFRLIKRPSRLNELGIRPSLRPWLNDCRLLLKAELSVQMMCRRSVFVCWSLRRALRHNCNKGRVTVRRLNNWSMYMMVLLLQSIGHRVMYRRFWSGEPSFSSMSIIIVGVCHKKNHFIAAVTEGFSIFLYNVLQKVWKLAWK